MPKTVRNILLLLLGLSLAAAAPALAGSDAALAAKINAGYDLLEQGKYAQAQKVYEEVLKQHPDQALALNNLASIFCKQKKYREAVALLQRALPKAGGYRITLNRVCNVEGVCAAYPMSKDNSGQENLEDVIKANIIMLNMAIAGRPGK
jgi:Tfp pilus assembly protein PilF